MTVVLIMMRYLEFFGSLSQIFFWASHIDSDERLLLRSVLSQEISRLQKQRQNPERSPSDVYAIGKRIEKLSKIAKKLEKR